MKNLDALVKLAQTRARELNFPYRGSLTPIAACQIWQATPDVQLVDVRTRSELDWVGRIPGSIEIEWMSLPSDQRQLARNPDFLMQLKERVPSTSLVLFICRSGARSHQAACAACQAGFAESYNVLEGFEGELDAAGQRGKSGGWRFAGLPWKS